MPPSSPFSFTAHLYPFSFPTPPPELPLASSTVPASSSSCGLSSVLPTSADLAQYRLRSNVAPSYNTNYNNNNNNSSRHCPARRLLSSPPPQLSMSTASSRPESEANPSPSVLFSPAPHSTTTRAMSPSEASEDAFTVMAANITCLFWFTPTQTLVHCSTHSRLPLLSPVCLPTREFRLFASAILSRTQVSRTVVALALLYIYRLKLHSPSILGTPGSEYRVFTIALVLANKFLDDNTYTNKTWAQVSKLPVSEIGVMEVEFLKHVNYELAVAKETWSDWSDLLACFVKARRAAKFSCVSVPGSPVSQSPVPLLSPSSLGPSRKRKVVDDDVRHSPAKRVYAQLAPRPTGNGSTYYYSPTTPSSDDGSQLFSDTSAQAAAAAFAFGWPVLPKPKYVAPMTPTCPTPNTILRSVPAVSMPQYPTPVQPLPLLVKNTYAIPSNTYALPTSLPPHTVLPQPIPAAPVTGPRAMPALPPSTSSFTSSTTTRANPFVYPVVDKYYVPVPRLMSVKQLHPVIADPGRW
ncbi:hypothetical protein V1506DRAFT_125819 [Lipomyces tetrasporus]